MTPLETKKQIKLTIPTRMFEILEKDREKYIYDSLQEMILDVLRDRFVRYRKTGPGKRRGRKRKESFLDRKKIFDKEGVAVDA